MIGTTVARGYESHKSDIPSVSLVTTNITDTNLPNKDTMSTEEQNIRLSFAVSLTFMVGIMQVSCTRLFVRVCPRKTFRILRHKLCRVVLEHNLFFCCQL